MSRKNFLGAVAATVMMLSPYASIQAQTLEPVQFYTWGVNNSTALFLEGGQVITEALLTFHNFDSDLKDPMTAETTRTIIRGGTTTTVTETPNFDSLKIYILDNPKYGFSVLDNSFPSEDPFAGQYTPLNASLENGNLVCRLSGNHNVMSPFTGLFNAPVTLTLADGSMVSLSSSLMELMDYAGTGPSVGFGIYPGQVRYYYDDITLTLTVRSFQAPYTAQTLVFHISDDMAPVSSAYTLNITSAYGLVTKSPNKLTYDQGEIVTLTAMPNTGYTFSSWSDPDIALNTQVYGSNTALSFTGIGQYVSVPTSGWRLDGTTITFWAKPDSVTGSHYLLGHAVGSWSNRIQLYLRDGQLGVGLGDTHALNPNVDTLQAGRWYHIALAFANGSYQVWVNGTLKAGGAYTGLTQLNTFIDLGNTGNPAYRSDETFLGTIEDVQVFASILTPAHIQAATAYGVNTLMHNCMMVTMDKNKSFTANFRPTSPLP